MQVLSRGPGQAVPSDYHEERTERTLFTGRLFSIIATVTVAIFALRDTVLFQSKNFVVWGAIGLLPILLFLVLGLTLFRKTRRFVVPLHVASLLGSMIAACGYTFTSYLLTDGQTSPGGNNPLVLITTLFFVFIFAAGARPYFAIVVLPPIMILTGGLLIRGAVPLSALAHLSSVWVFALAGIAASLAQERVFRNEFEMRRLAHRRGEELELEIERVRRLNQKLETEIEERKAIEEELEKRAAMDELTDVYNRRAGMEILTQSIYLAQRNKQPLSLCFVDVDDLKFVNDNFGHSEGDRLLRRVITVLKRHLRKSDYVSRIGGDEFLMVLPDCTKESAEYIMERIKDELRSEDNEPYPVNVSVGVSEYSAEHPVDPEALVEEADSCMYEAKQAKKQQKRES